MGRLKTDKKFEVLRKCEVCGRVLLSLAKKQTVCRHCRNGEEPTKDRPLTVRLCGNKMAEKKPGKAWYKRPSCRAECPDYRPCPFVGCQYNLYLDVRKNGNLTFYRPDLMPEEMPPGKSCALDIAGTTEASVDEIAEMFGLNPERVRQIIIEAGGKMKVAFEEIGINGGSFEKKKEPADITGFSPYRRKSAW